MTLPGQRRAGGRRRGRATAREGDGAGVEAVSLLRGPATARCARTGLGRAPAGVLPGQRDGALAAARRVHTPFWPATWLDRRGRRWRLDPCRDRRRGRAQQLRLKGPSPLSAPRRTCGLALQWTLPRRDLGGPRIAR